MMRIVLVVYVAGMIATAVDSILTKRHSTHPHHVQTVFGDEEDLRILWLVCSCILWPLWWSFYIMIHLLGTERLVSFAKRNGAEFSWTPKGSDKALPGVKTDYANVADDIIRDGRLVGEWGLLLTYGPTISVPDVNGCRWACIAKSSKSDICLVTLFDNEEAARQSVSVDARSRSKGRGFL